MPCHTKPVSTLALLLGATLCLAGCGDDGPPRPNYEGRAIRNVPRGPAMSAPTPTPPPQPLRRGGGVGGHSGGIASPGVYPSLGMGAGMAPGEGAAMPPRRDLAAELRDAVGLPTSCLAGVDRDAETIRIGINAYVDGTGRITRAYVAAPQLTEAGRACVQRLVLARRLRSPVPGAPRRVGATVEITQTPGEAPTTMEPPPPPNQGLPPGVRAIQAQQGTAISGGPPPQTITATMGTPISSTMGTPISSTMGTAISGPGGTPAGGAYP